LGHDYFFELVRDVKFALLWQNPILLMFQPRFSFPTAI